MIASYFCPPPSFVKTGCGRYSDSQFVASNVHLLLVQPQIFWHSDWARLPISNFPARLTIVTSTSWIQLLNSYAHYSSDIELNALEICTRIHAVFTLLYRIILSTQINLKRRNLCSVEWSLNQWLPACEVVTGSNPTERSKNFCFLIIIRWRCSRAQFL